MENRSDKGRKETQKGRRLLEIKALKLPYSQTTEGSHCGPKFMFVLHYCEAEDSRIQPIATSDVHEASTLLRGVKWNRLLNKPQKGG